MKNLFYSLFILLLSIGAYADDQEVEHTHENDYEDGCSNDIDDDLDGFVDSDDSDCDDEAIVLLEDFSESDLSPYLVWGVGIAILSSVGGDSGTGTATTTD